jgi:hypothetical protein
MSLIIGTELLLKGQPLILLDLLLVQGCLRLRCRQMCDLRRVPPGLYLPHNRHQQAYTDQAARA